MTAILYGPRELPVAERDDQRRGRRGQPGRGVIVAGQGLYVGLLP